MFYLNKPEKGLKKCKYIEKRVYIALQVANPLGCRNIGKVTKG